MPDRTSLVAIGLRLEEVLIRRLHTTPMDGKVRLPVPVQAPVKPTVLQDMLLV